MRTMKFRCFYRGIMYPVKEMSFNPDNSFSVSAIEIDLEGLGIRDVSPDSEHIEGIMQFTGLHDKNGIEIYEGDILSFFGDPIAVVEWQDFGGWSYRWIGATYERVRQRNPEPFFTNINLWSVIGNIYQNPELLNPTQP